MGATTAADGECRASVWIAGLQFYDYGRDDEIIGPVIPRAGDRLQIVRDPGNPYDRNACRVEWRNRFVLGHLPREAAASVAPLLDAGKRLSAFVHKPGDGSVWSLTALLVGPAAEGLDAARRSRESGER